MTEQELRREASNNNDAYVVHDGKIVSPRAIRYLKCHAIVHVVDKFKEHRQRARHQQEEAAQEAARRQKQEEMTKGKDHQGKSLAGKKNELKK